MWQNDHAALDLLSSRGGPFQSQAYRAACVATFRRGRDASFGGRTHEGATAAIALVRRGYLAEAMPFGYGGVVASRPLSAQEMTSFLEAARRTAGAAALTARDLMPLAAIDPIATTSVVDLADDPANGFSKKAHQSMRRGARAGAIVATSGDAEPFLRLYLSASSTWGMTYPANLIRQTAAAGVARFYDVTVRGTCVASAVALTGASHWMYWLAAQDDEGRRHEVGYLALAALLDDAFRAGAPLVNLGASAGLPGVAKFKRRMGGRDQGVFEFRITSARARGLAGAEAVARRTLAMLRRG